MLVPAIVESRVIRNGVDLSVFQPGDRGFARSRLAIPDDTAMLLFSANGIRKNIWKDYSLMRSVIAGVAERLKNTHVVFVALGEDSPAEFIGRAELRFVPYEEDPAVVAQYYQAANVYVHPARVDTFPNTVLEALACGTPVVATAVGGIPEQILDGETGFLIPPGDTRAMTEAIVALLSDEKLGISLGRNAARDAVKRFDLKRQMGDYLTWYQEILEQPGVRQ
jgi:glycosyltransferase involved in cell wall biosynthesis